MELINKNILPHLNSVVIEKSSDVIRTENDELVVEI